MNPEAFAAKRRESLLTADDRLAPVVQHGLTLYGQADWTAQILDTISSIWLENFQAEAPGARYAPALARFREQVDEYLHRTSDPEGEVTSAQVNRITRWLSTLTVNAGTTQGAYSRGIRFKRWLTMDDEDVRDIHVVLNGKIRPIGGSFDVGGANLAYPGEPIGPPEGWIQCRCVIQPTSLTGETMSVNTYTIGPEDDENPDIVTGYDIAKREESIVADAVVTEAPEDVQILDADDTPDLTEVPIHGVLAPEGILTGDSRGFREGALSTRPLPIPYRYEYVSSHGGNQTSQVATVGRIDNAWRDEATKSWRFTGVIIMSKEYASQALEAIIDGSGTGTSIDADEMVQDFSAYFDENGALKEQEITAETAGQPDEQWFSAARVAGLTQVPIPAFHEAYVGLGHEFEEDMTPEAREAAVEALAACGCLDAVEPEEAAVAVQTALDNDTYAAGTKDGPGWITHPGATSRIRRYWTHGEGAAKIAWGTPGDFNRCRAQLAKYVQNPDWLAGLCANMHYEVLKFWPATHAKKGRHALVASGALPAPIMTLVASAGGVVYPAAAFEEPIDDNAFPLRIDRETRTIAGYAAQWGVCHVGVAGMCQQAPPSRSNYSYFRKGVVDTDRGEQRVGLITYGIGHANPRQSAAAATAHYDRTGAVRAYINIGENDKGIWYAGVLAPWADDDDIDAMRAIGRVSGDWRNWSGRSDDLEMVGLVVVNTEGFQLAASGGVQTAAIGIGSLPREAAPVAPVDTDENEEYLARAVVRAVQILDNQKRAKAAEERAYALRLADIRERAERI